MRNTERNHSIGGWKRRSVIATVAALLWFFSRANAEAKDDYLLVEAKINGQPVKLAFDTGAETTVLFRWAAEKFGLRITNAAPDAKPLPGKVAVGATETLNLTIWTRTIRSSFPVIDIPKGIRAEIGGVVAWSNLRDNIIHIDAGTRQFEFLDTVPRPAKKWLKFPIVRDRDVLTISLPDNGDGKKYIVLDTGAENRGVALRPQKWNEWIAAHPGRARTLEGYYMPAAGLVVEEVSWADKLALGPLNLTAVSVEKSNSAEDASYGPEFVAVLGLDALKHLDLIINGNKGLLYARDKGIVIPPNHNRIGAVFAPVALDKDELLAHVLEGSPAYAGGIRNGDILLAVDGTDATKWRSDTQTNEGSHWERPAGTKTHLKLRRGTNEFETDLILKNLIGPDLKPEASESQDSPD